MADARFAWSKGTERPQIALVRKAGKTMGSIKKVAGGYRIRWMDCAKKRHQRTLEVSRKQARDILNSIELQVLLAESKRIVYITFADFSRSYIQEYVKPSQKPSSFVRTASIIEDHLIPFFGPIESLDEITTAQCQRYVAKRTREGAAPLTVKREVAVLEAMLNVGIKNRNCSNNATLGVMFPSPKAANITFLSPDQVVSLLSEIPKGPRLFFAFLVMTGVRVGEAAALQWKDVDFTSQRARIDKTVYKGAVQLPKTKSSIRTITLPPSLCLALRAMLEESDATGDDLVFRNSSGGFYDVNNIRKRVFYPAVERAGLPHMRIHDLRHTYASLLILQGAPMKYIQESLGHSRITTTIDLYGHLLPSLYGKNADLLEKTIFGDSSSKSEIMKFL